MKRFNLLFLYLICGSLVFSIRAHGQFGIIRPKPIVKVTTMPAIKLDENMVATPAEVIQIKKHIANLQKIDHPDYGFCSTMAGTIFAPIESSADFQGGILEDHQTKSSDDVRSLVVFGPKALPFLLAALSDNTPTRLTMKQPIEHYGGMFFSDEFDFNPANPNEQKAADLLPKIKWPGESTESYTLKVGDVCFAIIGEIVGRKYLAVRYQMTACVIINSPLHESALAKQVRVVWASTNSAQHLLNSLLLDYSTELAYGTNFLGVQEFQRSLAPGAAMRLLYYFPQESAGIIADQLERLNVNAVGRNATNLIQRETMNEIPTEDFIKAVSWSDAFVVRKAILDIFKKTTDIDILLAALSGIYGNETNLIANRLEHFVDRLPPKEEGPYGDGYNLLVAMGQRLGYQAKPTFVRFLKNAGSQRWHTMSLVLRETQPRWSVELLSPALADKKELDEDYALVPGQDEPRRAIRVCDEAAETISLNRPELKFVMAGEHADLDRQIAIMQKQIQKQR